MSTAPLSARGAAAVALDRIVRTGAYSNVLVARTEVAPATDHGYFQRLTYSALRHLPGIDRLIDSASSRSRDDIDPVVLATLRVAVADLLVLGTGPHAAVNEAVESLQGRDRRARPFVNAVLRDIAGASHARLERLEDAYPGPVIDLVTHDLGDDGGRRFLEAANRPAPTGIRFRPGADESGSRYAADDEDVGDMERRGAIDVIDPASVAVVDALGVRPGDLVADLAAAPGGKTRAIADRLGSDGRIVAMDLHARRVARARRRSSGWERMSWLVGDATAPPLARGMFDRVLVDAPCTGLGTLRRRPEIRYRVPPDAPSRYGEVQRSILLTALELVRPGGRLTYSVCTPFAAETTSVVAGLGFHAPEDSDGVRRGDGVLLGPDTTGTDGMFIAVFDAP